MTDQLNPSPEVLREMLVRTDARLEGARAKLTAERANLDGMTRASRRSRDGARFAAYVEQLQGTVEALEALMAGVRYQLGEGPEPVHCPHTHPAPSGGRLPCEQGWGHGGLHQHTSGTIRRRWE